MKTIKTLLLSALFLTIGNQLFAHALWIETSAEGKSGQKHEIKIFYGEYASGELEEISKWYSDVKDFTLWLTAPGKEKIKLAVTPGTNYYTAAFTPGEEGIYTLAISHEAKDLGGTTKYEFISTAVVAVGKQSNYDPASVFPSLKVFTKEIKIHKLNTPVKLFAFENGKPAAAKKVSVFSPQDWAKEFTTDKNGEITFTPQWRGRYVLEASSYEKRPGEHHGKPYEASWKGAASSFEVK